MNQNCSYDPIHFSVYIFRTLIYKSKYGSKSDSMKKADKLDNSNR